MKEQDGIDINALDDDEFEVWVPFQKGSRVLIRYVSAEDTAKLSKKATTVDFHKHNQYDKFDSQMFNILLAKKAVRGWEGIRKGEKEFPFNEQNLEFLVKKWHDFSRFVQDKCVDLQELQEAKEAEDAKNSELTSGQEQTSQG